MYSYVPAVMIRMAAGVSVSDVMSLLLLLVVLQRSLTFPNVKAYAAYSTTVDPYSNYTCPIECVCYKINETTSRPTVWINCTVSNISPHLAPLINEVSNPLTGFVVFTCSYVSRFAKDLPPESSLWDGAFLRVTQLKAVVFDHCRFKTLSKSGFRGLGSLTELIVREAIIESLDPDMLAYLPQLDVLEISNSALTHLFPLCTAGSLRVLNISGNRLVSLEDSGLRCADVYNSRLETLDVSGNLLTEIPTWLGQSLPNLYHLGIANNQISQTYGSPFQNLHKLTFLNFSNNSFTNFQNNFFKGCSNLHFLDVSMNKVLMFPRGLLTNLSVLQQLEISEMNLDNQVWMEISDLRQLIHLNMSNNKLTAISADVMSQLLRLEFCDLNNNKISALPRAAFDYQINLNTLDLSFNKIPEIPSHAFRSQYVLKNLYLQHNSITSIGFDAFSQLKELITFDISHNNLLSLPAGTFHGLIQVTYFDMSKNNLTVIDSDVFLKTLQISYLNISHNNLTEVAVLNQLHKLKIIDLSYNRILYLNPSFLLELRELTTVLVSHNELKILPIKLFKGCDSIKFIDLSYNSLQLLDEIIFSSTPRVQTIDLSHNDIVEISTVFSGLKDLETLDLSYNSIDKVLRGQFPHFIKHINLRGNKINFITAHTFKSLSRIRTVDLSRNKLTSLNRMEVEIAFNMGHIPLFNLQFNPFVCDCKLGWLKDWSTGKLKDMLTLPTFNINSGFGCNSPFHNELRTLQQLSRSEFLCSYTSHCEESCMCCDYACYCKYVCPASCNCYIGDDYLHVHYVHCNSANLTVIPSELPEGATDLRLDGNNIQVLQRHEFLALKHVEYLYLNSSQINTIQNNTFKGLKSVRHLYLNDNHVTAIYSVTFQGLDSLEKLFLQNNDIYSIDIQAFFTPPSLHLVNLQNNALSSIPLEELSQFINRSLVSGANAKIYLSGNPWNCELDFACKFLSFVQTNSEFVADISFIECVYLGITEKPLQLHSDSFLLLDLHQKLCGINQSHYDNITFENLKGSFSSTETYALIAACVFIVFAITLLIVIFVNRHFVQVLLFTKFGFRVIRAATLYEDNDRRYDAFISYSNKDEDFVIQQLAPRLENGEKQFKIYVHYRDFPVGACIAETIVRSVETSKRTILVVSDNFLDSEWCRFEFQTAHQQALSERRNRVILILMHTLDPGKLDDTLKVYMRTRTYLKYDDPWFWEKLMFAMPDAGRRKSDMPSPLPSSRDLEYIAHEIRLSEQQQSQLYPRFQTICNGSHCEAVRTDMYEIPVMDSPSVHYHLANSVCCSTHTNSAYHNSDSSDSTSGYHNGTAHGSCCHYEEVGPGSSSAQSTPQKQIGTPPPVPSIPKEGFVPRQKLMTLKV